MRDLVGERDLTFGSWSRRLRETASLTQEDLALRAGLGPLSDLERGGRQRPYPNTVRTLAYALELSEEERVSLLAALPRGGGRLWPILTLVLQ